jgi:hypothetical protein
LKHLHLISDVGEWEIPIFNEFIDLNEGRLAYVNGNQTDEVIKKAQSGENPLKRRTDLSNKIVNEVMMFLLFLAIATDQKTPPGPVRDQSGTQDRSPWPANEEQIYICGVSRMSFWWAGLSP